MGYHRPALIEHPILTVLGVVEIAYVVILSGWIVLQKRSPVATLAWVLTLAFLPVAGFVVFYFIGRRKVVRSRLKRLRARQALEGPRFKIHESSMREQVSRELARQIAHIGQTANVAPCSVATSCDVLVDGKETFARITAAIDAAEHHVHVLYYIFEPDQTGTALRDALVRAAARGCEVILVSSGAVALCRAAADRDHPHDPESQHDPAKQHQFVQIGVLEPYGNDFSEHHDQDGVDDEGDLDPAFG